MYPKRLSSFRIHVVYQFLMTGTCRASETSEFYGLTSLNVQVVVVVWVVVVVVVVVVLIVVVGEGSNSRW
jgi:hypothetical protein